MKYLVTWTEKHNLIVIAENKEEAIEKAQKDVDPLITESLYEVNDTNCIEQKE